MKTYRVTETCIFQRRYLEKDEILEFEDDVVVPIHLKLVDGVKEQLPAHEQGESLSQIQKRQREFLSPKTGFALPADDGPKPRSKR